MLSADSPDKEELKKLYNVGFNLDMDITELKDLQHAIARTEWVADVSIKICPLSVLTAIFVKL